MGRQPPAAAHTAAGQGRSGSRRSAPPQQREIDNPVPSQHLIELVCSRYRPGWHFRRTIATVPAPGRPARRARLRQGAIGPICRRRNPARRTGPRSISPSAPVPARIGSRRREPRSGTPALVFVVDGRVDRTARRGRPVPGQRRRRPVATAPPDGSPGCPTGPCSRCRWTREVLSGHAWPDGRRDVLVLPHAGSEVLRDLLESMVRHAADLTRRQAVTATTTVGALVRDALGADGAGSDPAQPADRVGQILAFIAANSHRTDITPETISAATGVSRSVLYRLLEPFGGVAACVKQRRLDAMRRALAQRNDCRLHRRDRRRQRVPELQPRPPQLPRSFRGHAGRLPARRTRPPAGRRPSGREGPADPAIVRRPPRGSVAPGPGDAADGPTALIHALPARQGCMPDPLKIY